MPADRTPPITARSGRSPDRPLVSVVTTTLNARPTLARCLESVAAQTLHGIEHVIVDGGSTDGTVELLRDWDGRLGAWVSERDRGIYDAMNKGVDRARGDWLLFLGADDVLAAPDVVERVAAHFGSGAAVVYGDIRYPNGDVFPSTAGRKLLLSNYIHHQGAFYAARVFDGWRYDTSLRIVADYDLNLRLYRAGERFERADVVVAVCGDEGVSHSRLWYSFRELNRVRRRHLDPLTNAAFTLRHIAEFGGYLVQRARGRR